MSVEADNGIKNRLKNWLSLDHWRKWLKQQMQFEEYRRDLFKKVAFSALVVGSRPDQPPTPETLQFSETLIKYFVGRMLQEALPLEPGIGEGFKDFFIRQYSGTNRIMTQGPGIHESSSVESIPDAFLEMNVDLPYILPVTGSIITTFSNIIGISDPENSFVVTKWRVQTPTSGSPIGLTTQLDTTSHAYLDTRHGLMSSERQQNISLCFELLPVDLVRELKGDEYVNDLIKALTEMFSPQDDVYDSEKLTSREMINALGGLPCVFVLNPNAKTTSQLIDIIPFNLVSAIQYSAHPSYSG